MEKFNSSEDELYNLLTGYDASFLLNSNANNHSNPLWNNNFAKTKEEMSTLLVSSKKVRTDWKLTIVAQEQKDGNFMIDIFSSGYRGGHLDEE